MKARSVADNQKEGSVYTMLTPPSTIAASSTWFCRTKKRRGETACLLPEVMKALCHGTTRSLAIDLFHSEEFTFRQWQHEEELH